jgi:hypothetical protein
MKDKIGALWLKHGKKGKYYSGEVNGVKLVAFPNSYKEQEKHPDFIVYKSVPKEENQDENIPF